eukprot:TRINITY_DN68444_c0_g1_i1.p1 TRINITY_DN68444_c0_g1~~TRINITY_DN68444_c0_g1_i1.p1  ORF type:complete len:421 (+),score=53.85 TRINITY_DN68444_c0_g1_i1:136-1263(+)
MEVEGDDGSSLAWTLARSAFTLAVPVFPGEPLPFGPRPVSEVAWSLAASTSLCCVAGYCLTRRSSIMLRVASRFTPSLRDEVWEEDIGTASGSEAYPPMTQAPPGDGFEPYPVASMDEAMATSSSAMPTAVGKGLVAVCPEDGDAEAAEKPVPVKRRPPKRTAPELLFIVVHNGAVSILAIMAWFFRWPSLALFAFNLEVAYEIFDSYTLGMQRLEPETLIHHIVSPICILCSTQTDVDFRVLCHLCICIDASGALLGYSKFLLRFAHLSSVMIYRRLLVVYGVMRVALPFIDTAIIVRKTIASRGGFFGMVTLVKVASDGTHQPMMYTKTDWTQLYFWAIAVLDAFNLYFFCVIRSRARMSPQLVAHFERIGCF